MEAELVSVCYVVNTRSTVQKSVCENVPALHSMLAIQSDPLPRAFLP